MRVRPKLAGVQLALGVVCVLYYALCALTVGTGINILYIWLGAGALLIGKAALALLYQTPPKAVRILLAVFDVGFFAATLSLLIFTGFLLHAARGDVRRADAPTCDVIVVLGAKVRDGKPSEALSERIDAAYRYLAAHPETVAVCSGGKGEDESISEAACIANKLCERGIGKNRLILEENSYTTAENLQNSLSLPAVASAKQVGIVSSNFHLFRAKLLFRFFDGRTALGIPAKFHGVLYPHYVVREYITLLVASAAALQQVFQ